MAIDRADWHWDSAEKAYREKHSITGELTDEQEQEIWFLAANHIGLFLRWIIERVLEGEEADREDCQLVRNGQMSGTMYFLKNCDGKFWDDDVADDALPFVEAYYNGDHYFADYGECCINDRDKPIYGVISDESDYQLLRDKIDAAYQRFQTSCQL